MLGRVAENLYWLGRSLERAENIARMADVAHFVAVEGGSGAVDVQAWGAVITATGAEGGYAAARGADPGLTPGEYLLLSLANPHSLRSTVIQARSLARELREQLSADVWQEINRLYLEVRRTGEKAAGGAARGFPVHPGMEPPAPRFDPGAGMAEFYDSVRRGIAAAYGLFDNTVLLDDGRDWLRCGIFAERADMTSRIIDTKYFVLLPSAQEVGGALDRVQWVSVLRSASAWQAFRTVRPGQASAEGVASMLALEARFPRSLLFCVRALRRHYETATADTAPGSAVHALRELVMLDLDLSACTGASLVRDGLHEFLDDFQARLIRFDRLLHEHVFRALPTAID